MRNLKHFYYKKLIYSNNFYTEKIKLNQKVKILLKYKASI